MSEITQGGSTAPSGTLALQVERNLGPLMVKQASLGWKLKNFLQYRRREIPATAFYRLLGSITGAVWIESKLSGYVQHADGTRTDYGVLSRRVVTTAGVGFIVDAFQGLVEPEDMKYHGFGTGVGAEASGDTALGTEFTTQYVTNSTRPTGSLAEGASANIFRSVGTFSPDSGGTLAVTEHGLFSNATVASGVLLDRSVFSAVNLVSGTDSLVVTYEITFTAGS